MRKKIVAGNWKMNTLPAEGVELAKGVVAGRGEVCSCVNFTVNRHDRGQTAGPQTGYGFQREKTVVGRLFLPGQAQIVIDRIVNGTGFSYMAGSTCTDLDNMPALCL